MYANGVWCAVVGIGCLRLCVGHPILILTLLAIVEKDEHVYPMVAAGKALHEMVFDVHKAEGLPPS